MADKLFITPDSLRTDSVAVARKVYDDRYHPNRIISLWRGGASIGLYMHEALKVLDRENPADYIPVITRGYKDGIDVKRARVQVLGVDALAGMTRKEDNVLIVDDVWDSGKSIDTFLEMFQTSTGDQCPVNIRIATIYYKPAKNKSQRRPDYFIHETDRWLVFPHELGDCTPAEIRAHYGPDIANLLKI